MSGRRKRDFNSSVPWASTVLAHRFALSWLPPGRFRAASSSSTTAAMAGCRPRPWDDLGQVGAAQPLSTSCSSHARGASSGVQRSDSQARRSARVSAAAAASAVAWSIGANARGRRAHRGPYARRSMPVPSQPAFPPVFHLAFPVDDLDAARAFYVGVLGCGVGREDTTWIDFDLNGHQIVAHLDPQRVPVTTDAVDGASTDAVDGSSTNLVDGDDVPVPHFGLVLDWQAWHELVERLRAAGTRFLLEPHVRFAGRPGEQATLFLADPAGNALEFKAFRDPSRLFARDLL